MTMLMQNWVVYETCSWRYGVKSMKIDTRFSFKQDEEAVLTWHNELEVVYIVRGTGILQIPEEKLTHTLKPDDIFAINPLKAHTIVPIKGLMYISMYIPEPLIFQLCPGMGKSYFTLYSWVKSQSQLPIYNKLRVAFARVFQVFYKNESPYKLLAHAKTVELLDVMVHHFSSSGENASATDGKNKLLDAITYVHANYSNKLTLKCVATATHLSYTYLSRIFPSYLGQTFTEYLNSVRLYYSGLMLRSGMTIADIADAVGFPTTGAMIQAYKKNHSCTPKEYRQGLMSLSSENEVSVEMDDIETFSTLLSYIQEPPDNIHRQAEVKVKHSLNISAPGRPLKQTWRETVTAGFAKALLFYDVQQQFKHFQSVVKCRYARIQGVFDDDMNIYDEDDKKQPIFNFVLLDEVVDFLLSIDLMPFICFNYMPNKLAKMPVIRHFKARSIVAIPKDYSKWEKLVAATITHLIKRYGAGEVQKWIFTPLYSPEHLPIGKIRTDLYLKAYEISHRVLKRHGITVASPTCHIGSPSVLGWFLEECKAWGCMPDIISLTSLNIESLVDYQSEQITDLNRLPQSRITGDESYIAHKREELIHNIADLGIDNIPLQLNEWNNNFWSHDLANDTCFKSCYILDLFGN